MGRPKASTVRKLAGLALFAAAFGCAYLKALSWDPAYKFRAFGGPWERLFTALALACAAVGAVLFLWESRRRDPPRLKRNGPG